MNFMANPQKNVETYRTFVDELNKISTEGAVSPGFDKLLDKIYLSFIQGFRPESYPSSDFVGEMIKSLQEYAVLVDGRKSVDVEGSKRVITTEREAYDALVKVRDLTLGLVVPFVDAKSGFANRMFHELHNLSFSCLESIVNGVAQEYIDREEATAAKLKAVDLAKAGQRIGYQYLVISRFSD